jgi:predicted ATPase/class 3 adenylate cyclase
LSTSLDDQINQLKGTIAEMEAQRANLGDAAVDSALIPFKQKLAELEAQAKPSREEPVEIPTRQRKLATILFMDLVGSTEMTQDLDPEDQMELVDPLIVRLAEKVNEFGGHVARYTGDGFKAVFGLPLSREDDPEQAIRAGLAIQAEASEIASELESEHDIKEFKVRLGITTGLVFAGGESEGEDTIKGNPVNLAARLQSAAPPGNLLISHDTYRHVRGVFTVDPQEPITAKGFPEPVPVYLVKEVKPRAFRVQTRGVEGVETRMVGREAELKYLQDALLTAMEEGEGHVVTVSGEAGVGKSRLLYEFQNWIELLPDVILFFQGRGRQEAQGLPYSLLRDVFTFRFQILDDDSGEQARRKIEAGFGEIFGDNGDGMMRAHIIGQLLGFDFSASPHLKGVLNDPEQVRNRGLMYLKEYFQTLSQESPSVIFLEDIHWGDDSSLDAVNKLGELTTRFPFLIVSAARTVLFEKRPYWGKDQKYHTQIKLLLLSELESRSLLVEILQLVDEIPANLHEMVTKRAEGNPFYLEEMIKMLIEDGVIIPGLETWQVEMERMEQIEVPSTLAGVLQARLDSLPSHERTVLQHASVVGRLFWDRIVSYMQVEGGNGGDPQLIPQALTSLRNRELVYRHEESAFVDAVEYLFKHDVLREVTYESVLKRLRKTYHGLVADWLINNCGDRIGEYSGLIADHLLMARREELACQYYIQAGEFALLSYANQEAETQFRRALSLKCKELDKSKMLEGLGESLSRQSRYQEAIQIWNEAIRLNMDIGNLAGVARLYTKSAQAAWWFDQPRGLNICLEGLQYIENEPDSHEVAALMHETARAYIFNGKPEEASNYCDKALKMAERLDYIEVQADTLATLGVLYTLPAGEDIDALTRAIDLAEKGNFLRISFRAHQNLGAMRLEHGDILNAKENIERAVAIAKQRGDIYGEFFSCCSLVHLITDLCELSAIDRYVQSLEDLATKISDPDLTRERLSQFQAILLRLQGKILKSLVMVRECRTIFKERGDLQHLEKVDYEIIIGNLMKNWSGGEPNWQEVEEVIHELNDLGEKGWGKKAPLCLLSIVNTFRGNHQEAHQFLEQAKLIKDYSSPFGDYVLISRATAYLAASEDRWEEAFEVYEDLIENLSHKGFRWEHAHALCDWGDAHVSRGESADLEAARKLYDQSLEIYDDLEALWYRKQIEKRLAKIT